MGYVKKHLFVDDASASISTTASAHFVPRRGEHDRTATHSPSPRKRTAVKSPREPLSDTGASAIQMIENNRQRNTFYFDDSINAVSSQELLTAEIKQKTVVRSHPVMVVRRPNSAPPRSFALLAPSVIGADGPNRLEVAAPTTTPSNISCPSSSLKPQPQILSEKECNAFDPLVGCFVQLQHQLWDNLWLLDDSR